jgi:cysteine desulfurase
MNRLKNIYLDYAAATPMDPRVHKAMESYFTEKFYNPSATYLASRAVKQDLQNARENIAGWLGARPGEIYFTAGATEANNMAVSGVMRKFPKGEVLVSGIEHDSVLVPAETYNCEKIAVTAKGIININDLNKKISDKTVLISVMMVNNEVGSIQPLSEIARLVARIRKERLRRGNKNPLYLHTDAAQAANLFDLHVSRLGVDMMSINGGKIYGPKQSGALFVRAGIELLPLVVGGGQERNMRSGTENVAGIIGLSKALSLAQESKNEESKRLKMLRGIFIEAVTKAIPEAQINGDPKHQAPHILHVTFPNTDNERLMMELDEKGVQAAIGSACGASNSELSHVLRAIGMSDDLARSSIRFSLGRGSSKKDILKTTKLLKDFIRSS